MTKYENTCNCGLINNVNVKKIHNPHSPIANSRLLDPHPYNHAFVNKLAVHKRLRRTDAPPAAILDHFAGHDYPVARNDCAAELDIRNAAKSQKPLAGSVAHNVIAHKLGGGFDHQHARKNRPAWNVGLDPELIRPDVAISDNDPGLAVNLVDSVQKLEFVTVRIDLVNTRVIHNNFAGVKCGYVDNWLRRHNSFLLDWQQCEKLSPPHIKAATVEADLTETGPCPRRDQIVSVRERPGRTS